MPFSLDARRWGLKKEGTRLTAETTATKWISPEPGSEISHRLELLEDKGLRGIKAGYPSHAGVLVTDGKLSLPVRTSHFPDFLQMIFGAPVSTELATITVSVGVNDKIDFTEDGGAAVAATLTPGTYVVGANSGVAGSFCKLVKDQMELAGGAPTYTVVFNSTTQKFTITKDSGVFVIQWLTGTNTATSAKTLLGFGATDTASAIAQTSTTTVALPIYEHVFSLPTSVQPPTYTFFVDRSLGVKKYNGCAVNKLSLKSGGDGFVMADMDIIGLSEAAGDIGTPSYASESAPLTFQHVAVKLAGAAMTNVKDWALTIDAGLFAKRNPGNQPAVDVIAPGKLNIDGTMTVYFEDEVERAKFLANTTTTLQLLIQGPHLPGGTTHEELDIMLYKIAYKAFPYGEVDGLLGAQVTFEAVYSATDTKLVEVSVTNLIVSF